MKQVQRIKKGDLLRKEFLMNTKSGPTKVRVISVFNKTLAIIYVDSDLGDTKEVSISKFESATNIEVVANKTKLPDPK